METDGTAQGELYWDDGITIDDELQQHSHITFSAANNVLTATLDASNYAGLGNLNIGKVEVWGLSQFVLGVSVNGGAITCSFNQDVSDFVLDVDCGDQLNAMSSWTLEWTLGP